MGCRVTGGREHRKGNGAKQLSTQRRSEDPLENIDEDTKRRASEQAEEMQRRYEPGARPTVTLPGTGGTVSGTAFADIVETGSDEVDEEGDTASGR